MGKRVTDGQPAIPTPADHAPPLLASLPPHLARAVARELGPGETVERVFRPGWTSPEGRRRRRLGAALVVAAYAGPGIAAGWGWGVATAFMGGLIAWLVDRQSQEDLAYVVTNARCFRLWLHFGSTGVREFDQPPAREEVPYLAAADRTAFREHVLARASRPRSPGPEREAPAVRLAALPPGLRERVRRALRPGETLRWVDRPAPGSAPSGALGLVLLALAAGAGFPGLMAYLAAAAGLTPYLAAATGGPGPGLLANPWPWVAAAGGFGLLRQCWLRCVAGSTVYGLTDQRGFILRPGGRQTDCAIAELRAYRRSQSPDGSGSLVAGTSLRGFYGIRNVRAVDDLIKARPTPDRSPEVAPADPPVGSSKYNKLLSPATHPMADQLQDDGRDAH
jgi:hypothetical protein